MEVTTDYSLFSDWEMDDALFPGSYEEEIAAVLGGDFPICERSNSATTTTLCASPPHAAVEGPAPPSAQATASSYLEGVEETCIMNFGRLKVKKKGSSEEEVYLTNNNDNDNSGRKKRSSRVRPPLQTYNHIVAERKRREQLSQLFVALSAILPGLKKMDKTSILGDAVVYLKQMQEKVQKLEEKATKQTMESAVLIRRSQLVADDDNDDDEEDVKRSSDENSNAYLPEIEARVSDKCVFVRIHCEKHKGILIKVMSEVEKLNLLVTNTSVTSFGNFTLQINIVAEMENEYQMTTKGLVRSLRAALAR